MSEVDEAGTEVLEVGADRRQRPSRRVVLGAALVALVLGAGGAAVDGRLRSAEQAALDRCASGTQAAVDDAWARVSAMVRYVRPVLDSGGSTRLRRDMYRLVSRSATGSADNLAAALGECHDVRVWPLHASLRTRRESCLDALDETTAFLRRLADDGRVVVEHWPTEVTGC